MTEGFLPPCPECGVVNRRASESPMMVQVTLYQDATLTIDGRAKTEAVPYVLRQIADAIEGGQTLVDIPMN